MTTTVDTRQHLLDTAEQLMAVKGYSAVGLTEVLATAGVPKGSFYHYFASKDAFGVAVLDSYFQAYLKGMDAVLATPGATGADRVMTYWQQFHAKQSIDDGQGRCLVVKLAAEVADLSEAMRTALHEGTGQIVARIAAMITAGLDDASLHLPDLGARDGLGAGAAAEVVASDLYASWLGASLLAKVDRSTARLDAALTATRRQLHL